MSERQRIPAEAFHPSVFIKDELRARRWSKAKLAARMGGDTAINLLALDMYFIVGPGEPGCRLGDMVFQLGAAFGVSPAYFRNLEKAWLKRISRSER